MNTFRAKLLLTLAIAGLLRFWAIDHGLPNLWHPDEPNKVIYAQQIFKTGDLNPSYYDKPSLLLYANALAYWPYYAFGHATGKFTHRGDIPEPDWLLGGTGKSPPVAFHSRQIRYGYCRNINSLGYVSSRFCRTSK